jgi:hypothetical protein
MEKETEKAFDFAADLTKQLITLAAGIITVTVTFSTDVPDLSRRWAFAAWLAFLISVISGLVTLMSLTGNLQLSRTTKAEPNIYDTKITWPSRIQVFAFLLGVVLTMAFGYISLKSDTKQPKEPSGFILNLYLP